MSVNVTFNGTSYRVPVTNDLNWGPYTTQYLYALGQYAASKASPNTFLDDQTFDGYIIVNNTGGVVLQAPGGQYFAIQVDDNGVLSTTPVTIS